MLWFLDRIQCNSAIVTIRILSLKLDHTKNMGVLTRAREQVKQLARKLIPSHILKERYIYRRLGKKAGQKYLGLRVLDMTGFQSHNARRVPVDAKSVVFVCFGNIMRSAMAEQLLLRAMREAKRRDIRVQSAGLHAGNGTAAHPWAQLAATAVGISLSSHRAKLLTREMVEESEAILAMDFQNKSELLAQFPGAADRIFMLSAYADPPWKNREIPDPYFGDEEKTSACCRALDVCVRRLLATLEKAE